VGRRGSEALPGVVVEAAVWVKQGAGEYYRRLVDGGIRLAKAEPTDGSEGRAVRRGGISSTSASSGSKGSG